LSSLAVFLLAGINDVTFPDDRREGATCHVNSSEGLPVRDSSSARHRKLPLAWGGTPPRAWRRTRNPTLQESNSARRKTPGGVGTIEHCEFFAKSNREMAKALHEMAAARDAMAKEAGK
jgi:hypothetical protein